MRSQLSKTGVYLEMLAKGDHQYSSILTDKVADLANKTPSSKISVLSVDGITCLCVDLLERDDCLLVDEHGLVPAPWSSELLDALRQLEESEAMPWLTGDYPTAY